MKNFFISIFRLFVWPFVGILFLFGILRLLMKAKSYRRNPNDFLPQERYKFVYKLIKKYLFLKNVKVEYYGFKKLSRTPYLFIANHKSKMDALGLMVALHETQNTPDFVFLGKTELAISKSVRAAMEFVDSIFIAREDLRQALEISQKQTEVIRGGRSMVIYGEGTRVKKHEMGEFKGGALRVAYDCAIPIVPVATYGSLGLRDSADGKIKPFNNTMYISCLNPIRPVNFLNASSTNVASTIGQEITKEYNRIRKNVELSKQPFPKE